MYSVYAQESLLNRNCKWSDVRKMTSDRSLLSWPISVCTLYLLKVQNMFFTYFLNLLFNITQRDQSFSVIIIYYTQLHHHYSIGTYGTGIHDSCTLYSNTL